MIANEWLKAAKDDLILIEEIIDNPIITNLAAFRAQQAIEKSLKAYLEYRQIPFKKTHKLQTLLELCEITLQEDEDELIQLLDELYIESRYPTDFGLLPSGKPSSAEVRRFFELAQNMYHFIQDKINAK